ncbi:B3 domain-containing protein Os04g0386900-like [Curcuma longa]|uniref:B3 domain-containing protein Os04g0386900-like n=1 Tax=Curcuma longa TaxID=136217 RepID=UPI003D9E8566
MFAQQREIVPLSGNPYFTCTMSRSDVRDYRLTIPKQFSHHMPGDSVRAILFCGEKMWEVHFCCHKDYKYFRGGWKAFAVDNHMRMGDGCVFELMDKKKMHFKVQILRGDAPDLRGEGGDGRSSSDPILVD